ncbi:MAG: twin-arginine translocation signal domain-containing protein, partial [Candidatus Rokubacteria bacterium]|nr:twin-arginine translocation signal domain-containing protein [Candidatus Rokubacteria bacterium]
MDVTRRDFLTLLTVAGALGAGSPGPLAASLEPEGLLDFQALGNVTLLHMTDPHGTLLPVHYREPDTRIGVGAEAGSRPFLTGEAFLKAYGIGRGSAALAPPPPGDGGSRSARPSEQRRPGEPPGA